MLRDIFRELFGTEFHSGTDLANTRSKNGGDDQTVIFPSGYDVSKEEEDIVPSNMENEVELAIDVEFEASESNLNEGNDFDALSPETAIDIEFPDAVNSIKPLDTNFLQEEGSGTTTWPKAGGDGGFQPG